MLRNRRPGKCCLQRDDSNKNKTSRGLTRDPAETMPTLDR